MVGNTWITEKQSVYYWRRLRDTIDYDLDNLTDSSVPLLFLDLRNEIFEAHGFTGLVWLWTSMLAVVVNQTKEHPEQHLDIFGSEPIDELFEHHLSDDGLFRDHLRRLVFKNDDPEALVPDLLGEIQIENMGESLGGAYFITASTVAISRRLSPTPYPSEPPIGSCGWIQQ